MCELAADEETQFCTYFSSIPLRSGMMSGDMIVCEFWGSRGDEGKDSTLTRCGNLIFCSVTGTSVSEESAVRLSWKWR
jgi:hypothetical protein